MLNNQQALEIFINSGALMEGHFKLTSGRHSNQYMQCAQLLQYPDLTEKVAENIVQNFKDDNIDIVIGPAMGGIIVAYEVARQMGKPGIFTERENGEMKLRRGFKIDPGKRVLVVEDVITTGGSVREVIEVVEKSGGVVAGVAVLVDRSAGKVTFGVKQTAVLTLDITSWEPEDCPLCKEGNTEAIKPGSRS
ncbi:MAG TPA: orotate phosphoribosyltransferase [Syntrophomonadaceae bacterium]|nr:orotate phosphoribosyltransferase [Syntrophomonadaceae bacterium]HPR93694.1 orotate phosphoribosyltransferase [Syntrophomonadaceae bacterium]